MISEIEKKLAILDKELHSILNIIKAKREYDVESEIRDFRKLVSDIKKNRISAEDTTSIIREMREKRYG